MGVNKPFRRTCRQRTDGSYANSGHGRYVLHPRYATAPQHYVRAFLLLQKDFIEMLDYVEPADQNLGCYSYRTHQMLLRACIEVEANCRATLAENRYSKLNKKGEPLPEKCWNVEDYRKLDKSHALSSYQVGLPTWHGRRGLRRPFAAWAAAGPLPWYQAYNATKHDRGVNFHRATFEHMLDAVCGVVALLSAQFIGEDFSNGPDFLVCESSGDGMEAAIGDYFRVKFPDNWPVAERYDFDWQVLKDDPDPFQDIVFPS